MDQHSEGNPMTDARITSLETRMNNLTDGFATVRESSGRLAGLVESVSVQVRDMRQEMLSCFKGVGCQFSELGDKINGVQEASGVRMATLRKEEIVPLQKSVDDLSTRVWWMLGVGTAIAGALTIAVAILAALGRWVRG